MLLTTNWGDCKSTQIKLNQIKCWFLKKYLEKNLQTQPTYDAESGNWTRGTLVDGKHSPHCANPDLFMWYKRPCWWASCALGHSKTKQLKFSFVLDVKHTHNLLNQLRCILYHVTVNCKGLILLISQSPSPSQNWRVKLLYKTLNFASQWVRGYLNKGLATHHGIRSWGGG